MNEHVNILKQAALEILDGRRDMARMTIRQEYPFRRLLNVGRSYTDKQKMTQFRKDGFIDRYSGDKLLNPGILKTLSHYLPDVFPYHPNWKMNACHGAYWELVPTVDHIVPVALGGADAEENWATTSMLHNAVKSNWTLEQLQWKLHASGALEQWDGLTGIFLQLVAADASLLEDGYIRRWYRLSAE